LDVRRQFEYLIGGKEAIDHEAEAAPTNKTYHDQICPAPAYLEHAKAAVLNSLTTIRLKARRGSEQYQSTKLVDGVSISPLRVPAGMAEKSVWHIVKESAKSLGLDKLAPHDLRQTDCRQFAEYPVD
jgi:integrase